MFRFRPFLLLIASLALVSACGDGVESPDVEAFDLRPLPVPSDEVVLTITGADNPNVADEVQIDLEGIEAIGTTTVTVDEPFINETLEVTGVAVDDLLAAAGVDPDATLVWTALDDYQVHFSRRAVGAENAILATRIDDAPIGIVDGGPIRVVFTDPDGVLGRDTNQWIWSLHRIEVQ